MSDDQARDDKGQFAAAGGGAGLSKWATQHTAAAKRATEDAKKKSENTKTVDTAQEHEIAARAHEEAEAAHDKAADHNPAGRDAHVRQAFQHRMERVKHDKIVAAKGGFKKESESELRKVADTLLQPRRR